MRNKLFILAVLMPLFFASCTQKSIRIAEEGMPVDMEYANLLTLTEGEDYITATITNPWDSAKVLHRYVLVPADKALPKDLPEGDIVRTPLKKAVVYSSVHTSLIDELGAYKAIAGICDLQYMLSDKIKEDVKSGKIENLGNSKSPNYEKLIALAPDAILLSPYENNGGYDKLEKLGVPIIECADYMENLPLGRAEWMRFYGILFGQQDIADELFIKTAEKYNDLCKLAQKAGERPSVLCDTKYGSVWNISGGNSTTGHLLADAGSRYIFASDDNTGSKAYAPEKVFEKANEAEFWLIKNNDNTANSYSQLASEYPNYSHITAFRNHNIWVCDTSSSTFYEDTPFHPEVLLMEYIKLFHPNLLPSYEMKYFKKLEE